MRQRHLLILGICWSCLLFACRNEEAPKTDRTQSLHELVEAYHDTLGNPNSERYDEEAYIAALASILKEDELAEADSMRVAYRLKMAMKNRPGTIASDFSMENRNGHHYRLSEIKANRIVLIFYDPECGHCRDILEDLRPRLRNASAKVVAVYTEGNKNIWLQSLDQMPKEWEIAIDCDSIVDNEIYSIPAMPTIYLLDADKKVILKDPSISELENEL